MAAYRRVYDSRHLQADCQEPGSARETYARYSSMGYLYLFSLKRSHSVSKRDKPFFESEFHENLSTSFFRYPTNRVASRMSGEMCEFRQLHLTSTVISLKCIYKFLRNM